MGLDNMNDPQGITGDQVAHESAASMEAQVLTKAVLSLPPQAVKELVSIGVCARCIFRLFGVRGECTYSSSLLSPSIFSSIIEEPKGSNDHYLSSSHSCQESVVDPVFCRICLGILEFTYEEKKEMCVKRDSVNDFVASIVQLIKQEGHQIDSFSIEVAIPSIILENERVVRFYMEKKYGSEVWFQENFLGHNISVKDALKLSITGLLEKLLAVKCGESSFRIRLTYAHGNLSLNLQTISEREQGSKRMKTGTRDTLNVSHSQSIENSSSEADIDIHKFLSNVKDQDFCEHLTLPSKKVNQPCHFSFHCYRMPIYIGGRYLKYSRNVSQTRWIIDDERMGEASVEEIIGSNLLPMFRGDNYKFHAAGREDIDVRMLGSGRPFLVEIQNAHCIPCKISIKEIEEKINSLQKKLVGVKNLKVVGSEGWTLMREGEAEKQKQYVALVWISRPLKDEDIEIISSFTDTRILQRTPIRVLHRRSPLEREKIIHWMKVEKITGSSQYFLLHLCTQAGTYIKEFVHGDLGRTHPNVGSILGCRAEILQLDVTEVKMDCFLTDDGPMEQ
ncbi:PREDICTED: putative tRNA pseudouridine synthase Pus10 [Nelumbo nucifera]|uniref:tRNA pseudouridine(55) synthase n=2 Tax=Nelumbo nucifera TaxID=4432 RepID=A0A1U8ASM8_NELNU|nr:PREDICTED: putative tRNA pseudouridine synthase Pus10 [Nelumbo nucifera]DAD41754.1 TPA_asm: hypothetical protein HUJ06_016077 [Nelumbo nucifera]